MKQVLVLGNGSASSVFCKWFTQQIITAQWKLVTVSEALLHDEAVRQFSIAEASLVVSFAEGQLHQLVAEDCITFRKHLISPAKLNEKILNLHSQIENAGVIFLYELGFDPGLDHMSALELINAIKNMGGEITSFHAHSGRLLNPANTENPWKHCTNDAASLVNAGKQGAVYKENGNIRQLTYHDIFNGSRLVEVPGAGFLAWYPATDSMGYIPVYGLNEAHTVVRGNLRHPDFMYGWKNLVDLKLTDDTIQYETANLKLAEFFKLHFDKQNFQLWLEQKMMERFNQTKQILEKLMQFMEVEQEASEAGEEFPENLMVVDDQGKLGNIDLDEVKDNAAAMVAYKMHEANLTLKQLFYLGMDDQETIIEKTNCSASEALQIAIGKKLSWHSGEHDMAVMLQEIEYEMAGHKLTASRQIVLKGTDEHAAVDVLTGITMGIIAVQILQDKVHQRGLHLPVMREVYEPVIEALSFFVNSFTPSVAGFSMVTKL